MALSPLFVSGIGCGPDDHRAGLAAGVLVSHEARDHVVSAGQNRSGSQAVVGDDDVLLQSVEGSTCRAKLLGAIVEKGLQYVINAWDKTKRIAEALRANVCIMQTPPSFGCTEKNKRSIRELMNKINRDRIQIGWEPRGSWQDNESVVRQLCEELDIIHIVDLMRRDPVADHAIAYTRLHGLNKNEHDYDYDYSDRELKVLAGKLEELAESHDTVYCMFNNNQMFDNASSINRLIVQSP